ncbi:hypothetical protein AK812_SmicGene8868 [Symbiodinium microadriaticum]|uniref:Uncharacterized protein n=1 Tax=Symbiodinium microadriaticum TaxID=2951 RepID=A0A1Q9EJR9_SYMMI|nr:hypothetical protein AK812_SmicGene8868 [Symbiodinium microadriaticum]
MRLHRDAPYGDFAAKMGTDGSAEVPTFPQVEGVGTYGTGMKMWNPASFEALCQIGYLGPPNTNCTVDATTCQVTTQISGCRRLQPCTLPEGDFCRVNMTSCRPFELYSAPGRATCPEGNLDPAWGLRAIRGFASDLGAISEPWRHVVVVPPTSDSKQESQKVPLGYEFGIDQRSPAAIEAGWYCSPGYVGEPVRVCGSNITCGVIATRSAFSRLPGNFDPLPLDKGFSGTRTGFNCSEGYAGPIQFPDGCAPPVPCRVSTFEDVDEEEEEEEEDVDEEDDEDDEDEDEDDEDGDEDDEDDDDEERKRRLGKTVRLPK